MSQAVDLTHFKRKSLKQLNTRRLLHCTVKKSYTQGIFSSAPASCLTSCSWLFESFEPPSFLERSVRNNITRQKTKEGIFPAINSHYHAGLNWARKRDGQVIQVEVNKPNKFRGRQSISFKGAKFFHIPPPPHRTEFHQKKA